MRKIYRKSFDGIELRFVTDRNNFIFVSEKDISQIIASFDKGINGIKPSYFMEKGLKDFLDNDDKKVQVIADDQIGLCYNIFAFNSISSSMADLHDVDSDNLREISYRFHAFQKWFMEAYIEASTHFDIDIHTTLVQAVKNMDKHNPAYVVEVTHIDNVWIGECDELGLVTEAPTYEKLTENCWELVPDLVELNNIDISPDNVRMRFEHIEEAPMLMVK